MGNWWLNDLVVEEMLKKKTGSGHREFCSSWAFTITQDGQSVKCCTRLYILRVNVAHGYPGIYMAFFYTAFDTTAALSSCPAEIMPRQNLTFNFHPFPSSQSLVNAVGGITVMPVFQSMWRLLLISWRERPQDKGLWI